MTENVKIIAATLEKIRAAPMPTTQAERAAMRNQLATMAEMIRTAESLQALAVI